MWRDCRRYRALKLLMPVPLMLLIATSMLAACGGEVTQTLPLQEPLQEARGDPQQGQRAIQMYGCGACHAIPGVEGADGTVGPPLTGWANRTYIAGRLPNTSENLAQWIQNPQAIDPENIMPNLGVSEEEARDIAAYLYTLE